jgi:ubiquinone/menaquinone biosynthesis C-methylase UbiE
LPDAVSIPGQESKAWQGTMTTAASVERHYASQDIAGRILAALRAANGVDAPITVDALAPVDHFHGRGVAATRELVELLKPQAGERLLDIGSGLGGPARWIAAKFACHVTGVDLTAEFCTAAEALSAATGMTDKVTIINGSALNLPVPDNGFDRAYSQNVVMNIEDKPRFYRESFPALRPGGVLALSNICAGAGGDPYYPMMWAETPATSFLATPDETRQQVVEAGFEIVSFRDTTADVLAAQRQLAQQLAGGPPPVLGIHVFMGERVREAIKNAARSLAEGRTGMIEALVRKPV